MTSIGAANLSDPNATNPCDRFAGGPGPIAFWNYGAAGWPSGATGALEIIDGPTRCGFKHVAIKANGAGPVTVTIRMAAIGVKFAPTTMTWNLRVSGTVLASHTTFTDGGLAFWNSGWYETIAGIAVAEGDLITVDMEVDPFPIAFFSVDDFASGGPGMTGLYVVGDLVHGTLNRRMRGSGSVV